MKISPHKIRHGCISQLSFFFNNLARSGTESQDTMTHWQPQMSSWLSNHKQKLVHLGTWFLSLFIWKEAEFILKDVSTSKRLGEQLGCFKWFKKWEESKQKNSSLPTNSGWKSPQGHVWHNFFQCGDPDHPRCQSLFCFALLTIASFDSSYFLSSLVSVASRGRFQHGVVVSHALEDPGGLVPTPLPPRLF